MRSERYYMLLGAKLALQLASEGHSLTPEVSEQIIEQVVETSGRLYPETDYVAPEGSKVIKLAPGGAH